MKHNHVDYTIKEVAGWRPSNEIDDAVSSVVGLRVHNVWESVYNAISRVSSPVYRTINEKILLINRMRDET